MERWAINAYKATESGTQWLNMVGHLTGPALWPTVSISRSGATENIRERVMNDEKLSVLAMAVALASDEHRNMVPYDLLQYGKGSQGAQEGFSAISERAYRKLEVKWLERAESHPEGVRESYTLLQERFKV